jgi:hypothetical protein
MRCDRVFENMGAQRLRIFRERQARSIGGFEKIPNGIALGSNLGLVGPCLYGSPTARRPDPGAGAEGRWNQLKTHI